MGSFLRLDIGKLSDAGVRVAPLFESLLPHCFKEGGTKVHRNVQGLIEKFISCEDLLKDAVIDGACICPQTNAWKILIHRMVIGSSQGDRRFYDRLEPCRQKDCAVAVESFMLELERLSMELQRHCPRDWNQFVELLIQSTTGDITIPMITLEEYMQSKRQENVI